ncbi:hypothetical protein FOA19_15535 [Rufibacter hautae]|uniref:Uncharacterized protein n=1 Tax=Rufibacter hautae TaxID=2595005 RepID=A0A5B6TQD1_9BACT|nr:hypothetical protein FOA19_15535 [Rufibacter hautae]
MKLLFFALLLFAVSFDGLAQTVQSASPTPQNQPSYPISLYRQATKTESHLLNGPEYVDYRKVNRVGHQFFLQDQKAPGSVLYDGSWYHDVPMLYDLVLDQVVIVSNGFLMQKLIQEKVDAFVLGKHLFVAVTAQDSASNSALPVGFYDVLHDGNTKLLAKRIKLRTFAIEEMKEVEHYDVEDKFFVKKGNGYHQVSGGKSVYKVFGDKKKELKKYARAQKLNFRKAREASLLALVLQYDALQK